LNPFLLQTCSQQGGFCDCNGYVRYGQGTRWSAYRTINGRVYCNDGSFGDPYPGAVKHCVCAQGSDIGIGGCESRSTGCQLTGNLEFWDRQSVSCPGDKLLTYFRVHSCSWQQIRTDYTCCSATRGLKSCRAVYTACQVSDGHRAEYLDRHDVKCDHLEGIKSWSFTRWNCPWGHHRYAYTCCTVL